MPKSKSLRKEPMLVEGYKDGHWYGQHEEQYVAPYRAAAERLLNATPQRFVYLAPNLRVSYYEGKL